MFKERDKQYLDGVKRDQKLNVKHDLQQQMIQKKEEADFLKATERQAQQQIDQHILQTKHRIETEEALRLKES